MIALTQRNIKIYFSNIPGVLMLCLGALISFFIYISFLKQNLLNSWKTIPNATKMLDLWMIAGIVAVAGITTSFQALGQLVKDRESRTMADFFLTDTSLFSQHFAYVIAASLISFIMQLITFIVMAIYFTVNDHIQISNGVYWQLVIFMVLGAMATTMLNSLIVSWINSSTTFSRMSAIIGTIAGFAVATYLPLGALSKHAQSLVKWVPSSYEVASIRSLLLSKVNLDNLPTKIRTELMQYLGVHLKIQGHLLTKEENAYVMITMMAAFTLVLLVFSLVPRKVQSSIED